MYQEILKVLEESGPTYCSDAELCAAITGASTEKVKSLLSSYNIGLVQNLSISTFKEYGITKTQALRLKAAISLQSRLSKPNDGSKISCSRDIYDALRYRLHGLEHEEFWVLAVNNAGKIIKPFKVSSGGTTGTVVDIKLVAKAALAIPRCCAVVLAHNHPSGSLQPSMADISLTKNLFEGLKTLDIRVLDHLIITEVNGYYSFADEGAAPF